MFTKNNLSRDSLTSTLDALLLLCVEMFLTENE